MRSTCVTPDSSKFEAPFRTVLRQGIKRRKRRFLDYQTFENTGNRRNGTPSVTARFIQMAVLFDKGWQKQ